MKPPLTTDQIIQRQQDFLRIVKSSHDETWIVPRLIEELLQGDSIRRFCQLYNLSAFKIKIDTPATTFKINADGTHTQVKTPDKFVWAFANKPTPVFGEEDEL